MSDEYLTFDSVDLTGPIVCDDLASLRDAAFRGRNVVMPTAAGQRPYAPVPDQLDTTLLWRVVGRVDPDGAPHVDPRVGVESNLEFYRVLFTEGGDPVSGEHDVVLHFAGDVWTGGVQVWGWAQRRTGPVSAEILTRLVVPGGGLSLMDES